MNLYEGAPAYARGIECAPRNINRFGFKAARVPRRDSPRRAFPDVLAWRARGARAVLFGVDALRCSAYPAKARAEIARRYFDRARLCYRRAARLTWQRSAPYVAFDDPLAMPVPLRPALDTPRPIK